MNGYDSGASLGDILEKAMDSTAIARLYDVRVRVSSNGRKISAVKAWRDASGMSLTDAKAFVEGCDYDNGYRTVRMTEQQLGRLYATRLLPHDLRWDGISISAISAVPPPPAFIDVSKNRLNG